MTAADRLREALEVWAIAFLNGLSFNEPTLQRGNWAERRAPDIAASILADAGVRAALDPTMPVPDGMVMVPEADLELVRADLVGKTRLVESLASAIPVEAPDRPIPTNGPKREYLGFSRTHSEKESNHGR